MGEEVMFFVSLRGKVKPDPNWTETLASIPGIEIVQVGEGQAVVRGDEKALQEVTKRMPFLHREHVTRYRGGPVGI